MNRGNSRLKPRVCLNSILDLVETPSEDVLKNSDLEAKWSLLTFDE
jgi:hypothetical protein